MSAVKCSNEFDKQAVRFGPCAYDRQTRNVSEKSEGLYLPAPEM